MNGRVYDPAIARFVSADPFIQSPGDLQSFNRYAYVRNNPASLVDPSGYGWLSKKWKQIRRVAIAAVAVTICVSTAGAGCGVSVQLATFSATMAARRTLDHGGTLRQAIGAAAFSIATSAVFYGVGQAYGAVSAGMGAEAAFATKVAMHGVAGCGVSAAGGGSCGAGFVSSGVAAGYSFLSDANGAGFSNNDFGSIIEAGVVGGATRQVLGGSFSEGFEAGAAGQAYNALALIPVIIRGAMAVGPRALAAYRGYKAARAIKNALQSDVVKGEDALIKAGSAGGETAGRRFPDAIKDAARAENPTATCVYCRMEGTGSQVDHAIPKARGGNATLDNAQLACPHCNASKGAGDFPKTPPEGYVGSWPPTHW